MSLKRQTGPETTSGKATARLPVEGRPHYPAAARARVHDAEYFRTLIESATDGVAVALPDGTVQYHNPALTALLGYASREFYAEGLTSLER
ncbi:MAG: PAS domain-containing protein [Verrucomicrobiota bacterium]|nr:PAS domain-containing protein [Verrucomicrobiota bacterium]